MASIVWTVQLHDISRGIWSGWGEVGGGEGIRRGIVSRQQGQGHTVLYRTPEEGQEGIM